MFYFLDSPVPTFLLGFVLSYYWGIGAYAQDHRLQAYTIEDGLPQSQVFDITQDEIGYLWIGTQGGGISQFDGKFFRTWNETHGLQSNYIRSLTSIDNRLFIGTKLGLSIKTNTQFKNYDLPSVNQIVAYNNAIYLATQSGLYQYDTQSGVTKVDLNPKINSSAIRHILDDGKLFWIATNTGLWKIDKLSQQTQTIVRHSPYDFITAHFSNNTIYAAVAKRGILRISIKAKSYKNNWLLFDHVIQHIATPNRNTLWLATRSAGIQVIDLQTEKLQYTISQSDGLSTLHIRKSYVDRQSTIWIASSGGGLYKYAKSQFIHYDQESGLKGNQVYAVCVVENSIWASNSDMGLIRIDSSGVSNIQNPKKIAGVKIKTITKDTDNNIWVGTEGKGIVFKKKITHSNTKLLQPKGSIAKKSTPKDWAIKDSIAKDSIAKDSIGKALYQDFVITKKQGLPSDWIRKIIIHDDLVWVATYSSGIICFVWNSKRNKIEKIKKLSRREGLKDLRIRDMKIDQNGRVWYGTKKGHLGYIQNKKLTHLGAVLGQEISLNSLQFHREYLYLGTAGKGIWWSSAQPNQLDFKKLEGVKRLYSENVYQLLFDQLGNLWSGSEKGVEKIIIRHPDIVVDRYHFGKNDGFLGIETCLNAAAMDRQGNLWFGTLYGLAKYRRRNTEQYILPKPKLFFEDVKVTYQSIDTLHLSNWVRHQRILRLSSDQTELAFKFKSIDLNHPADITYRWRLNQSRWSPWSTDSHQNFAGLAYGKHKFTVQSRDYRWQKSELVSFNFFVDNPIYQKIGFIWTVCFLMILLITVLAWRYINGLNRKNLAAQERLRLKNHLLSLEQKALRLQMNPHFIFNVLHGIKAMANRDLVSMNKTIHAFAVLLRETLYNSRKDYIRLDQELSTIKSYIEIEKMMSHSAFAYTITLDSNLDPEEILIPPMLVQPFVENSIRHGILKGNRAGELQVSFRSSDDMLLCSIRDNGNGIFESQKNKPKTDHQSMALRVTRQRLVSISGENALQIKELKGPDQTVIGTQVDFKIPLHTDY